MSAEHAKKVQAIVGLTSVQPEDAIAVLEAHGWSVEASAQSLLQVLNSRKRKPPPSFDPTPQETKRAKPKKRAKQQPKSAASKNPRLLAKNPSKKSSASKSASKPSDSIARRTPADSDQDASSTETDEKSQLAGEVR